MWNRLTQVAGLGTAAPDSTMSESPVAVSEMEEQMVQQNSEIQNLKVIVRENETLLQEKNKELEEIKSKFQKFKLQSKAKICQLSNQLKELEKPAKKDDGEFEDTSSSDSSDQSNRGKVIVLKKQLEQARQQVHEKEREVKEINKNFEAVIKDLQTQLDEREKQIFSLKKDTSLLSLPDEPKDTSQDVATVHELYAQMVYKDSKMIELNNEILKKEREILDLQEHIKEKDEVLQSRNRAIQLMTADMNRKGKSVVDELDEVRQHMRIMQENFTVAEGEWKEQKHIFNEEIKEMKEKFEENIKESDMKLKNSEDAIKKLEVIRHDLATKNAELQRKLVVVQENADKHCENFRKQVEEELHSLRRNVEQEKSHSMELQRALDEATDQSEAKVLKARVKERTKFKALERELKALREIAEQTPDEVTHLHHCIAELEEEKGSLQLKLLEVEEQIDLQERLKTDQATLNSSLKETKEKYVQVEMLPSGYEKGSSDLQSPFSGVKLHEEQILTESNTGEYDQENEHLSKVITLLREENLSSEARVIDSKNLQEGIASAKQGLLHQIHKLQDMLNSKECLSPVVGLGKKNNIPNEKILQLDEFHDTEIQELQNVFCQSDDFHKELNELQNKCYKIIEDNQKFKLENELLKNVFKGKKMLTELKQLKEWFSVNDPNETEISSLIDNYSSQQVLLNDLFSICMVQDLIELKEKYVDMMDNIKNLSSSLLEKDTETENYKQQYEKTVDVIGKLQLDCQTANNELKNYSELIKDLKVHISIQEKTYNDQINELNQHIEDQKKENSYLIDVARNREKLLQKADSDVEEKEELIRTLTENITQQSNIMCQLEKQTEFLSGEIEVLKQTKKSDDDKVLAKTSSMLEQISDLEAEVSKLQAEVSSKQQMCDDLEAEMAKLQAEIFSKQQMCDDLEKKSNYFKALYENLLEDKQAYNTVCKDYENKLENLQQQILLLENEIVKKNQEIEIVQKTMKNGYEREKDTMLKVNQDSINSLEAVLSECRAEKDELLKVNIAKESEIMELQTSLKELTYKLDSEISKSVNIYREYQFINEENKVLNGQLLDAKNQVESLKMEVSSLCASLAEKEGMNENILSDNMKLKLQVNNLKNENEKLFSMADEVKLKNTILVEQNGDIFSQLEMAKNDLSAVNSRLHDMVFENETLKQTSVKFTKDLELATDEIKSLKEKCLYFSGENEVLRQENSDLVALTKGQKQGTDKINDEREIVLHTKPKIPEENSQQMDRENSNMTEKVVDMQTVPQTVKELSLNKSESHIDAMQDEIKEVETSNISIRTETAALSDDTTTRINNLFGEIDSYQHQLLCAKVENDACRSKLENETKAKLCLQEEVSRYEAAGKCLKTALLSALQENKNLKTNLLNLKSDAQLKLNQYSLDLINLKNELNIVTDNFCQKGDELAMLLENSLSENTVLRETKCDLNERLKKSCILVQNLTEEKDMLQKMTKELEQHVEDLMGKLLGKEEQYELSLEQKQVECEKQLSIVQKDIEHLTLFKTQYLFIVDKLLTLQKCVIDETGESIVKEGSDLEFPKDFHMLEDIIRSIENKFFYYIHQISKLSSDLNMLCSQKETLIRFSESVQDENSSLRQKIDYLEDNKDTLVSVLSVSSKKVSDITKMNSESLSNVLDIINSKNTVLQKMETSVTLFKKTFPVLKKQLEILQSENESMKDQINCNSQEILYLQNINNDLLKESQTKIQIAKQKVSKKLTEHTELLLALKNWINQQGEKIRHLIDFRQMSPTKTVLLPDEMSAENELQKQRAHSDIKAEKMVVTKENPTMGHVLCHSTECKEFESSEQLLYLIEERVKELISGASLEDDTKRELLVEQKTNENVFSDFISTLKDSEISIGKLQSQIKELDKESSSYKYELEFYTQAKNSLQTEVQNMHSDLAALENEKLALKQELESIMHQLQCTKMNYEEKINFLQTEINNYTQINKKLTDIVEEKNILLVNKQAKYDELVKLHIGENEKYNLAQQELNALKLELERRCKGRCSNCKELMDEGLKQNMEDMLKHNFEMKKLLKDTCDMLCDKINHSSNLFCEVDLPREIDYSDNNNYMEQYDIFLRNNINMIMKSLNEKQCKLQKTLSDLETIKVQKEDILKTLNDKTCLCEELSVKVEELKKSLMDPQAKLKLSDDKNNTMAIKIDESVVQTPNFDVEDQLLTEKVQEGCTEKLCCDFEACRHANESLHHQLNIQKMKYDKILTKLKVSRDQVEELRGVIQRLKQENKKLLVSHEEFLVLQEKQLESNGKLQADWKAAEEEKNCEIHRLQILISELKERISFESNLGNQLRTELQQYKELWEQSNSTFELQKEENEQLQLKVKKLFDELENVNLKMSELHNKCIASDAEKKYLQHIVEGLKENINMLISDNDTFQQLTEKLSQSKAALEKDIAKLKENNPSEMNDLKNMLQVVEEQKSELSDIKERYQELKNIYSSVEEKKNCLESRVQDILKDKEFLESRNKDLYNELCQQSNELHHLRLTCSERTDNVLQHDQELYREKELENKGNHGEREIKQYNYTFCGTPKSREQNQKAMSQHHMGDQNFSSIDASREKPYLQDYSKYQIEELIKEKQALELHINYLTDELQSAMIKKETAVEECLTKEKEWKNASVRKESQLQQQIAYLQMQLLAATSHADGGGGIMQEPVSNVNVLETELQQTMKNLHQQSQRCEELSLQVSKLLEERNDLRLKLSQWHQHSCGTVPNSGLASGDNSVCSVESISDEFRLLLGDDDSNEPEVFADTNFSITHRVKSSTRKFERWIRSRRNYLCRIVRSKNYYQFLYLMYLFAIHIWIIICTFGHS